MPNKDQDKPKFKTITVGKGLNKQEIEVDASMLDKFLQKNASPNKRLVNEERLDREVGAFHAALMNGGNMQKAMLDAGYPKHMVTPQSAYNLSQSKSFKEMLGFYFPPEVLMEHEASLLNSKNPKWKDKSLDRLHKLLGNFEIKVEVNAKSDEMKKYSDEELYAISRKTATVEDVTNTNDNDDETKSSGTSES